MTNDEIKQFLEWAFPKWEKLTPTLRQKWFYGREQKWLGIKISSWIDIMVFDDDKKPKVEKSDLTILEKKFQVFTRFYEAKNPMKLEEAVKEWGSGSLNDFYGKAKIAKLDKPPKVILGPSTSKGHYDPKKNIIWINPRKNHTKKEMMDTLNFEVCNASQREEMLKAAKGDPVKGAWISVKNEYLVSKGEFIKSKANASVKTVQDLVDKLGISPKILKDFCKKRKFNVTKRVPMPTIGQLSKQKMRNAVFWFQVDGWSKENQIKEFALGRHTPGSSETSLNQEIRVRKGKPFKNAIEALKTY